MKRKKSIKSRISKNKKYLNKWVLLVWKGRKVSKERKVMKVGKMAEQKKVKISISLDKDVYDKIKKHCDEHLIKLSAYINHVLKKDEK